MRLSQSRGSTGSNFLVPGITVTPVNVKPAPQQDANDDDHDGAQPSVNEPETDDLQSSPNDDKTKNTLSPSTPAIGERTSSNRGLASKAPSYRQVQQQAIEDQMAAMDEQEDKKSKLARKKTKKNIFKKGQMWSNKLQNNASIIMNQQWITSKQASYFLGIVVLLNGILMGLQADAASHGKGDAGWYLAEVTFLLIFTAELIQRARAAAEESEDRMDAIREFLSEWWNIYDLLLVVLHGFQVCIVMPTGDTTAISAFQMIRLACLLRIFRLFRELVLLGYGILGAMRALVWAVWLLIVFLYICSVGATRLLGQNVETIREENREDVKIWFGSMDRSFFTLMQLVTLENWPDIVRTVMLDHELAWLFFIPFLIFSHYTLLNLVTAVIVENVLVISQKEQNQTVKRDEQERLESMSKLKTLFEDMDDDGNGELSLDEFHAAMKDENVIKQFNQLEIAQYEAVDLFDLLDTDHNGSISVSEFIEGALRVRGTAKAKHLLAVQYDLQKCWNDLDSELVFINDSFKDWVEKLHAKLDADEAETPNEAPKEAPNAKPLPSITVGDSSTHVSTHKPANHLQLIQPGQSPKKAPNSVNVWQDSEDSDVRKASNQTNDTEGSIQEQHPISVTTVPARKHSESTGSGDTITKGKDTAQVTEKEESGFKSPVVSPASRRMSLTVTDSTGRTSLTTGGMGSMMKRRSSIDSHRSDRSCASGIVPGQESSTSPPPLNIARVASGMSSLSAVSGISTNNKNLSSMERKRVERLEAKKEKRAGNSEKYDQTVTETKTILAENMDRLGETIAEIAKSQEDMNTMLSESFEVLCRQLADLSHSVAA